MGLDLSKIKGLLRKNKITQEDLGEMVGLSRQQIGNIIKRNSTTHETLSRIAYVLNVPITYFYDDITDEQKVNFVYNLKEAELENEIEFLKQQLAEKTEYIELLKAEIARLKNNNIN